MYPGSEIFRNPSNFSEIEGLVNNGDIDATGFIKITSGITSTHHWYIRVFHLDIFDQTAPTINPAYPLLGPLQVIKLNTEGRFKKAGEDIELSLVKFFKEIIDMKALTVSRTATYQTLINRQ